MAADQDLLVRFNADFFAICVERVRGERETDEVKREGSAAAGEGALRGLGEVEVVGSAFERKGAAEGLVLEVVVAITLVFVEEGGFFTVFIVYE